KFYLFAGTEGHLHEFIGPSCHDRLDFKLAHFATQQLPLTQKPQTHAALQQLGITHISRSDDFLTGYLFFPWEMFINPDHPALVWSAGGQRGFWVTQDSLELLTKPYTLYGILPRPHWRTRALPPDVMPLN